MKKGVVIDNTGKWTVVLTPEGEFLKIPSRPDHLEGKEVLFLGTAVETKRMNKLWTNGMFRGLSALTACILLFLVISPLFGNSQAYAAVTIDINPSLELEVDEQAVVIQVSSYNEEGQKLLNEIEWRDKSVSDVTITVIQKAETMGYMNEQEQVIITTTYLHDQKKENITKLLEDTVKADQDVTLVLVEGKKEWHEEAKKQAVSPGTYIVEKKVAQEGIHLGEKNIKKVNLKELPAVHGIKVIEVHGKHDQKPNKVKEVGEKVVQQKTEDHKQEKVKEDKGGENKKVEQGSKQKEQENKQKELANKQKIEEKKQQELANKQRADVKKQQELAEKQKADEKKRIEEANKRKMDEMKQKEKRAKEKIEERNEEKKEEKKERLEELKEKAEERKQQRAEELKEKIEKLKERLEEAEEKLEGKKGKEREKELREWEKKQKENLEKAKEAIRQEIQKKVSEYREQYPSNYDD